jgi:hypothetical protein
MHITETLKRLHGMSHSYVRFSPSKCRPILVILLLLSKRVFKRGSFGKPSKMMMLLSDKSILSNWFCTPHECQVLRMLQKMTCFMSSNQSPTYDFSLSYLRCSQIFYGINFGACEQHH